MGYSAHWLFDELPNADIQSGQEVDTILLGLMWVRARETQGGRSRADIQNPACHSARRYFPHSENKQFHRTPASDRVTVRP